MVRLRFHASWLPKDHDYFWTMIDSASNINTVDELIHYFNEQQKSLAAYYQFDLPKRSTKSKYLKAFINDSVLPPHAQVSLILRENDEIDFRLEIDAKTEWLLMKPAPTLKRKLSVELESPSISNDLDNVLQTLAKPTDSTISMEKTTFSFQFGNKRGRPIPPRPPVMSAIKVNSLIPRQVMKCRK